MKLTDIKVTQRNINRPEQIPHLINTIKAGCFEIPPIELSILEDGQIQVEDGHHRLVAYYLAGRKHLKDYEYNLLPLETKWHQFGTVKDLAKRASLV
jgi:hypothetical protein